MFKMQLINFKKLGDYLLIVWKLNEIYGLNRLIVKVKRTFDRKGLLHVKDEGICGLIMCSLFFDWEPRKPLNL